MSRMKQGSHFCRWSNIWPHQRKHHCLFVHPGAVCFARKPQMFRFFSKIWKGNFEQIFIQSSTFRKLSQQKQERGGFGLGLFPPLTRPFPVSLLWNSSKGPVHWWKEGPNNGKPSHNNQEDDITRFLWRRERTTPLHITGWGLQRHSHEHVSLHSAVVTELFMDYVCLVMYLSTCSQAFWKLQAFSVVRYVIFSFTFKMGVYILKRAKIPFYVTG